MGDAPGEDTGPDQRPHDEEDRLRAAAQTREERRSRRHPDRVREDGEPKGADDLGEREPLVDGREGQRGKEHGGGAERKSADPGAPDGCPDGEKDE